MVWVNKSLGHNSNKSLDSQDTNVLDCSVNKAIFDRIIDEVPLSDNDAERLFVTGVQVCGMNCSLVSRWNLNLFAKFIVTCRT